ncbi:MAG: hypothetical protein H6631_03965 [Anaerolineaceae bacterium]|nr:hypothetical protein [Anaerolineaceae bacterium]
MPTADLTINQYPEPVEPGTAVTLLATLTNKSDAVHHYRLDVRGDDIRPEWIRIEPPEASLQHTGSSQTFSIAFAPPREPASKAGDYPLTLVAVLMDEFPLDDDSEAFTLSVKPFLEVISRLEPDLIRSGQNTALTLTNKGNNPQAYLLQGYGPAKFRFREGDREIRQIRQVEVKPGETEIANVRIEAERRPWFRQVDAPSQLELRILSKDEEELDKKEINLIVEPRFSIWPILIALLLLCTAATFFVWFNQSDQGTAAATPGLPLLTPEPTLGIVQVTTTPTPIADAILQFTLSDQTIVEGECVNLTWADEGLVAIFLNETDVTGRNSNEVCPTTTTTYDLNGRLSPGDPTFFKTAQITITVNNILRKSVFAPAYPPGYILNGDELSAQGVSFTIEDKLLSSNCKKNRPAVGVEATYKGGRYFTTFVPKVVPTCEDCAPQICKSVPLSINFSNSKVLTATVYFLNPTNAHQGFIFSAERLRNVKGSQNVRYYATYHANMSGDEGIRRIDVGLDPSQPPAVVRIDYEYQQ